MIDYGFGSKLWIGSVPQNAKQNSQGYWINGSFIIFKLQYTW